MRVSSILFLLFGAASLAGCGGGESTPSPTGAPPTPVVPPSPGSPPPPTSAYAISGIASFEGKPAPSGSVSARCASGATGTASVGANGNFIVSLGQLTINPFPCMLQLSYANTTLHGYATSTSSDHNINLLTELTLAKALRALPATAYSGFGQSLRSIAQSELLDAPQFVEAALQSVSGYRSTVYSDLKTPDPFTSTQARADRENLLNAVAASMRITGVEVTALRALVAAEGNLRESFAAAVYKFVVLDRAQPENVAIACSTPVVGGTANILSCKITGRRLSRPVLTPLVTGESVTSLGLSVSRKSQWIVPWTDAAKPRKPVWCSTLGQSGIFKSTDTAGRDSPDPLGVFAEEIVVQCGPAVDFSDDLFAEVTIDNGNREGPPGWNLVAGANALVSIAPTQVTSSVIHSAQATCETAVNPPPFALSGPWVSVSGTVSVAAGDILFGVISKPGLMQTNLINGWLNPTNYSDGVVLLNIACIYPDPINMVGACTIPIPSVKFENNLSPSARATSLTGSWSELGLVSGKSTPLEVHLFIVDVTGSIIRQRWSAPVICRGPS